MISVCLAAYNGGKYIGEQLRSILCQLGPEDEVIVSDDGSTDGTLAAVFGLNDPRIRVVRHTKTPQRHAFDYTTHNFENALRQARGEYVFLSDQDDVWLAGKVDALKTALADHLLAVSDCRVTDGELRVMQPSYFALIPPRGTVMGNLVKNSFLGSCMAFRRELLERALPFPRREVPHDLWLGLLALHYGSVAWVREPLMLYRRHEGAISPSAARSSFSLVFKIRYRFVTLFALLKKILP